VGGIVIPGSYRQRTSRDLEGVENPVHQCFGRMPLYTMTDTRLYEMKIRNAWHKGSHNKIFDGSQLLTVPVSDTPASQTLDFHNWTGFYRAHISPNTKSDVQSLSDTFEREALEVLRLTLSTGCLVLSSSSGYAWCRSDDDRFHNFA